MIGNRTENEDALARALSRHIGYTTAAYDLDRILSVLEVFHDRPSAVKEEIIAFLRSSQSEGGNQSDLTDDYLAEIISFARAMRIVQQTSGREARLQRFSPTELGRSLLSSRRIDNPEFSSFFAARIAFLADADSLVALLMHYRDSGDINLFDYYVTFFQQLRNERERWLQGAFPEAILQDRISSKLSWISPAKARGQAHKVEVFTRNTARHHATPRRGWLQSFGMVDDAGRLTAFGSDALGALLPGNNYFWLGPPRGIQEALHVRPDYVIGGPFEDEFNFSVATDEATSDQITALAPDVAKIMVAAYPFARLIHASQASLELPLEYIKFRSYRDKVHYDELLTVDEVFRSYRDQFDRLSALKGKVGFYRVR
ncbi:hypothetical protein [Allosphingosinicella indica]|uniref:Uncharacterized protein n=1 Tax=Allosphingosinicella indica TaxID=941907 RepID=A0A1X7G5D2_9SPHN|nr:hypothetical protein [Allosphingosinicella indica]SMF63544.1 hypothetical protein SAMN06295910_1095 [Allosphingosinicella indica]